MALTARVSSSGFWERITKGLEGLFGDSVGVGGRDSVSAEKDKSGTVRIAFN